MLNAQIQFGLGSKLDIKITYKPILITSSDASTGPVSFFCACKQMGQMWFEWV